MWKLLDRLENGKISKTAKVGITIYYFILQTNSSNSMGDIFGPL